MASASADHAATLQVPSTKTAGLPMVDATCNVWTCWMHASTAIELNPQVFACAHASRQVVVLVCLPPVHTAGQGRAGEYNPSPSWLWQCLRLNASHSLARVQNLFEPLVSLQSLQPQLLLSAILKWALAQESWHNRLQTRHVWYCLLYTSPRPRD